MKDFDLPWAVVKKGRNWRGRKKRVTHSDVEGSDSVLVSTGMVEYLE